MRFLIPFAATIAAIASSFAEMAMTAESAGNLAKTQNPDLRAARALVVEAEARKRTTGRLANPELESEVAGGEDFEGRVAVGVTQRFPITSRLRLERELSALDVEKAKLEIQDKERLIALAARKAYYDLAAVRESIRITQRQTQASGELARQFTKSVADGLGSQLDAQQAELAAESSRAAEETLKVDEIEALARLNGLLGLPAGNQIATKESLELPRALPKQRPLGVRPDLLLADLAVKTGSTDVSLAKASRWDDFGVALFVEGERFRDEPEGIEPEALIGARFSIPLPFWQNGSGKVAEKQAAHERMNQQLEALQISVKNEIASTYQSMSIRYQAAERSGKKLVLSAKKQVADLEAAYGRAESDIQALFRARERLAEIELSALAARKNYFVTYSAWLASLGAPANEQ